MTMNLHHMPHLDKTSEDPTYACKTVNQATNAVEKSFGYSAHIGNLVSKVTLC